MTTPVHELLDEVKERAFDRCMELAHALVEAQLGSDGETFGDAPLNRGDRILRFQDYAQRGVLDHLKVISPKWYERMYRQYLKDIKESPLVSTRARTPSEPEF